MNRGAGIALVVVVLFVAGLSIGWMTVESANIPPPFEPSSGKIIFVDDDFVDDPENHKWNTIQEGVTDADPGDTVAIFNGNYSHVAINKNNLTLSGETTDGVIVEDTSMYTIGIYAANVSIQNLTAKKGAQATVYTTHPYTTLRNCTITQDNRQSGNWAVRIASDYARLTNCTIKSSGWGIHFSGVKNCSLRHSQLFDIENKAIVIQNSNNIRVADANITNTFCGIRLLNTIASHIFRSNFSDNKIGVIVDNQTVDNVIQDCMFKDNAGVATDFGYGIYMNASSNNTVVSCQFFNNDRGLYAESSTSNNLIHHNNFINNGINAYDRGSNKWNSSIGNYWHTYPGADIDHNGIGDTPQFIKGNYSQDCHPLVSPIQDPPTYVWVDDDFNDTTPGWSHDHFSTLQTALEAVTTGGHCFVYEGQYANCSISQPVSLRGASNTSIAGGHHGIFITANDVLVSGFTVTASDAAIKLQNVAGVTVTDCSASQAVFGVYLINIKGCHLQDLSVHHNQKGFLLFNASASTIWGCQLHNNSYFGMEVGHTSSNNTIADCHFTDNGNYAAYIVQQSVNNRFLHNSFLGNTAYDTCGNQWGGSYNQAVGNYWSTHTPADELKGEGQNHSGKDGFVDSPYSIPGGTNATDSYPLCYPVFSKPRFVWIRSAFSSHDPGWGHDHFSSIQAAVEAVATGGGCFVFNGIYREQIMLNRTLLLTGQSTTGTIVAGVGGSGFTVSGDNVSLHQFTVHNCWNTPAIHIPGDHNTVQDCIVADSYYGLLVTGNNTTINGTMARRNAYIGIALKNAQRPAIQNCSILENNKGVVLSDVVGGLFANIEIHNNSVHGLALSDSANNTFHHLYFIENMYGAYAEASTGNLFYFNDFLGNEIHAWDNSTNNWDNGTIGNYWQGYDGGSHSGGTYTTPYNVPGGDNQDTHPLVRRAGLPVPSLTYTPPGNPFTTKPVTFTDTSIDLDGVIVQRYWEFGDGFNTTSTDLVVTHRYSDNGTYMVSLTVTDDDGNTATTTRTLTVLNAAPSPVIQWKPLEPTNVDLVRFNGSGSVDPDGEIVNYTWSFGDGNTSYGENVTHRYSKSGTYTVTLMVTDDDGSTAPASTDIDIGNALPNSSFTVLPESPTTADLVRFNGSGSVDPDGEIVNYTWSFGDGNTSYGENVTHRYADNGTYIITLTVTDDYNTTGSMTKHITVANTPPRVDFSYQPMRPDDISKVRFSDTTIDIDGIIVSWQWTFGDGTSSSQENPDHIFPENKVYTVTLTVTDDDGDTNTTERDVTVYNVPPQPSFNYEPATPTDLDTVSFFDTSADPDGTVESWAWTFGDGNSSTVRNPSHAYAHNGLFTITLTVTDDDGDSATESYSVLIANVPPEVNFSYTPKNPTDTEEISFNSDASDPDGEIVNYTWSFGDGNTSYGENVTHRYADNGTYLVTLTVKDDDDGTTTNSRDVNVSNVAPTASFTYEPDDPKKGDYITFQDTSSDPDGDIVNATWYFGDGTTQANGDILNHQYDSTGDYEVTLIVTDDDGATDTVTQFIEVRDEDEAAGFEFVVLVAAIGILLFMWERRMGVWRRR